MLSGPIHIDSRLLLVVVWGCSPPASGAPPPHGSPATTQHVTVAVDSAASGADEIVFVGGGAPVTNDELADCRATLLELQGYALPVAGDACSQDLRVCVRSLSEAGCPMRPKPQRFVPPPIRCSGDRDDMREAQPAEGAAKRRSLPSCLPVCIDAFRVLEKAYDDAYASWLVETEDRRRFCDQAR